MRNNNKQNKSQHTIAGQRQRQLVLLEHLGEDRVVFLLTRKTTDTEEMLDDVVAFRRSVLLDIFLDEMFDNLAEIGDGHGGLGELENETTVHEEGPGDTLGSQSVLKHLLALWFHKGSREHHFTIQHELTFPDTQNGNGKKNTERW